MSIFALIPKPFALVAAGIAVSGALFAVRRWAAGGVNKYTNVDLNGKTAVITGANTGIGLETAVELAKFGATVIVASRDSDKTREAIVEIRKRSGSNEVYPEYIDLASLESVRTFAENYKKSKRPIHILVLNAGVMMPMQRQTTKEGFELQFGVNHLAHFALVGHLLDVLKASAPARIVVVSSRSHERGRIEFDDLQWEKDYKPMGAYGQSKLANILFANELNRRLKGSNIVVNSVHPGVVKTELSRFVKSDFRGQLAFTFLHPLILLLFKTPQQGAQTQIFLSVAPEQEAAEIGGFYFADCKVKKSPNPAFGDLAIEKKLWEVSERLTGVTYQF